MTRRGTWAAVALASLALVGPCCRQKAAPAPAAPAVATFDGGSVTAADVDRAVLDLPAGMRQPADGDLLAWYERIARDLAMEDVLVAEARQGGLDRGPDFERARDEARREAVVQVFLAEKLPPPVPPQPREIEAYYVAHIKDFKSPAARATYHIFRRVEPGADPAPVMAEMRRLRARILAGENFVTLAEKYSESETRHQGGLLGIITPGKVSPDLERVVFALKPGVPSEPVKTAAGVHVFLVPAEAAAKTLTLSEVRNAIARVLMVQARQAAIDRLIGTSAAEGSFVPSAEQLRAIAEAGDPSAVVLRAGDFQMTLGQMQARMLAGQVGISAAGEDTPGHALLVSLERRERTYRLAVQQGFDRNPKTEEVLQRLVDRELAGLRLRKRLVERLDRDPRRLQDYYDANRGRFSSPLRLRIQRLSVPLTGDANRAMARLERARTELDSGRLAFDRLATEVGGTLLEPAWELPTQLAEREQRLASPVSNLKAGHYSSPYRTEDHIEMVKVLERAEPELQALDKVRDKVRADFLATHRADEYGALVQEVLAERHYAVVRPELEAMLKRPTAG
jgi:parvulin-like peptidyl-prolyl isomerase